MGFYKDQTIDYDDRLRIIYKSLNGLHDSRAIKYKNKSDKKIIFFEVGKLASTTKNVKDLLHITKYEGKTQLSFKNGNKYIVRDAYDELVRQL